jgi:hypothetical protein
MSHTSKLKQSHKKSITLSPLQNNHFTTQKFPAIINFILVSKQKVPNEYLNIKFIQVIKINFIINFVMNQN